MSRRLPVSPGQGQRVPPVLRVHFRSYILLSLSHHRSSGLRGAIHSGQAVNNCFSTLIYDGKWSHFCQQQHIKWALISTWGRVDSVRSELRVIDQSTSLGGSPGPAFDMLASGAPNVQPPSATMISNTYVQNSSQVILRQPICTFSLLSASIVKGATYVNKPNLGPKAVKVRGNVWVLSPFFPG